MQKTTITGRFFVRFPVCCDAFAHYGACTAVLHARPLSMHDRSVCAASFEHGVLPALQV